MQYIKSSFEGTSFIVIVLLLGFVFVFAIFLSVVSVILFFIFIINFQQLRRDVGKLGYSYESEVLKWSNIDFDFSYSVRDKCILTL